MATIAEKTATPAQLLDDIGTMLDGLASWTREHSTDIQNSGDDGSGNNSGAWQDNGLLYSNVDAGIYLLMTLQTAWIDDDGHDGRTTAKGLRFHVSTDWDSTAMAPAGLTDTTSRDPWSGSVGTHRDASFDQYTHQHDANGDGQTHRFGGGVYWRHGNPNTYDFRAESVSYFASAGNDYITVGAWKTDVNNGGAGYVAWENTNQKFWEDGSVPYSMWTQTNAGSGGNYNSGIIGQFGFNHIYTDHHFPVHPYDNVGGFDSGAWGLVNPDANDDTFFFRRPVIYQTHQKRIPMSYARSCISNDRNEGGAHGDTITHNGTTYQILRQSGGAEGTPACVGLRYE